MIRRIKLIFIALDQLLNTLLGGWPDETLSCRCWRKQHWFYRVIDIIFFFQPNHCYESYVYEMSRRDLPPSMRDKKQKEWIFEVEEENWIPKEDTSFNELYPRKPNYSIEIVSENVESDLSEI